MPAENYEALTAENLEFWMNTHNGIIICHKHLCPHCKDGNLRRIHGRNGWFWACSNYPHCTATYDDNNGMPVL